MKRNPIREHPVAAAILAGAVIVATLAWGGYSLFVSSPTTTSDAQAFFTVDDGTTYFTDDAAKRPPFDHDGKPAVRAYVFTDTKAGDRRWVQYLQKFSDEEKKQMEGKAGGSAFIFGLVKKPGAKDWIPAASQAASEIMMPRSQNGAGMADIRQIFP
jgi:hypothetical protein